MLDLPSPFDAATATDPTHFGTDRTGVALPDLCADKWGSLSSCHLGIEVKLTPGPSKARGAIPYIKSPYAKRRSRPHQSAICVETNAPRERVAEGRAGIAIDINPPRKGAPEAASLGTRGFTGNGAGTSETFQMREDLGRGGSLLQGSEPPIKFCRADIRRDRLPFRQVHERNEPTQDAAGGIAELHDFGETVKLAGQCGIDRDLGHRMAPSCRVRSETTAETNPFYSRIGPHSTARSQICYNLNLFPA